MNSSDVSFLSHLKHEYHEIVNTIFDKAVLLVLVLNVSIKLTILYCFTVVSFIKKLPNNFPCRIVSPMSHDFPSLPKDFHHCQMIFHAG
jgi:hypothetical protein